MNKWLSRLPARGMAWLVAAIGVAFVGAVLVPGLHLASQLYNNTAALKFAAEQRRQVDALQASLGSAQDRLMARGYVQSSINEVSANERTVDQSMTQLSEAAPAGWFMTASGAAALVTMASPRDIAALRATWDGYRNALGPVASFQGVPYRDSEEQGTQLTDAGNDLNRAVVAALRTARQSSPLIDANLGRMAAALEANNAGAATELRLVMLVGLALAVALVLLLALLLGARRQQDAVVRDARQQTEDILQTVKEGLFLLDKDLRIGAAHSSAMKKLFRRDKFAGLPLEELLRDIVPARTLETTMKYVRVLWSERTKENLVKSINPLGEVEVIFD
jgi:two-component system chemotaxis sensor kinase CheA